VRAPSLFSNTLTFFSALAETATQLNVVPKSIPNTGPASSAKFAIAASFYAAIFCERCGLDEY